VKSLFINPIPFPLIMGRGILVSEGALAPSGFPFTMEGSIIVASISQPGSCVLPSNFRGNSSSRGGKGDKASRS